jgi:hypothetical protein
VSLYADRGPAYADDVVAVSFSPEGLQRHIDTVVALAAQWRVWQRTSVKSQTRQPLLGYRVGSVAPETVRIAGPRTGWSSTRYKNKAFGDLVPGDGWDHHADKALIKMRSAYGYYGRCWHAPVSRLECAHATDLCLPAVTYGAEVWDCTDARANVGGGQGKRARKTQ